METQNEHVIQTERESETDMRVTHLSGLQMKDHTLRLSFTGKPVMGRKHHADSDTFFEDPTNVTYNGVRFTANLQIVRMSRFI